jgi:hypothetical protein
MSKSKVSVKKNYVISKVNRVMRMKDNDYEPATYEIYKVTGPNKFKKYFCSRKDAKAFVDKYTNNKISAVDVFTELKRIDGIKLPIQTI